MAAASPYDPAAVDARLRGLAAATAGEEWLAEEVGARRRWLHWRPEEPPAPGEQVQVIHGDYQLTNLFFDGDALSCVIDWDKARPEWPAWEVVRTLDYAMGLDPSRGTAFIDGYRSVRSLPPDELRGAAARWGHHTAHGVWLYEEAYLRGNARAVSFIGKRPWVPFIERWERSGLA